MNKRLNEIKARLAEISGVLDGITDAAANREQVRTLNTEMDQLEAERDLIEAKVRAASVTTLIAPVAKPAMGDNYRQQFMDFVLKGTPIQQRIDATAATTDLTAIIPSTIMSRVIESLEVYGRLYARATKLNVRGGVSYPISSLKPTATWTTEGSLSDKQKMTVSSSITFTYNKLQCRVAVTLEADTVALDAFETLIANSITRAMIKGLELSMVAGDGTGEMKGITIETPPAARIASITAAQIGKYETWAGIVAKVPQAYRQGSVLVLTQTDWDTYIVGMTDATGQPICRTSIGVDGYPVERLLGFETILVESGIDTFAAAANTDVIGFIVKLEDYVINSNLAMTMKKYFDESTDEWIHKATLIADGKLVDTNGLVLIKASK